MQPETSTDIPQLRGPVPLSHLIIRTFVRSGDNVVDATCGNGNDTLLLAGLVGPSGTVWAFDLQHKAILATAGLLAANGLTDRVRLLRTGHESLAEHVASPLSAVVFNLGYLPGGDRSIITRPDTTLSALDQGLQLLMPGGILAITVYPGHQGGEGEERLIGEWAARLSQTVFHSWRMGQVNTTAGAPSFILIQKVT